MKKIILSLVAVFFVFLQTNAQEITVEFPNGGEHFTQGIEAPHNIIWTSSGITSFKVEYSIDNGENWTDIATNVTETFLNWQAPMEISDQCLIKVSDASGSYSDSSDAVFSLVEKHNYYALWETSMGNIRVMLHNEIVPITAQNFINLAERGFYNNLVFHRVIENFMIQGGCPLGNGTGSPGYEFDDEFSPLLTHSFPGVLSMANAGPNTNGSQYFITTVPTSWLDNKHAVFGRVVDGMDVVFDISKVPTNSDAHPLNEVVISSITISDYTPTLNITSPTENQIFVQDDTIKLEWESQGIADLKIEFSADNGNSWTLLEDSLVAYSSEFQWIAPGLSSAECLFKLTDLQHSETFVVTNPFEIKTKPVEVVKIEFFENVEANPENPSNMIMPAKPLRFKIKLRNNKEQEVSNLTVTLSDANQIITQMPVNSINVASINQAEEVFSEDYFEIIVPEQMPNPQELNLVFHISIDGMPDETCFCNLKIPVLTLGLFNQVHEGNSPNSEGNDNDIVELNETWELGLNIANESTDTVYEVFGQLVSPANFIEVWNNHQGANGMVYDTTSYNGFKPINPGVLLAMPNANFVFDYTASEVYFVPLYIKLQGYFLTPSGTEQTNAIWAVLFNLNEDYPVGIQEDTKLGGDLKLFQNPTQNDVNFSLKTEKYINNFDVKIFDITGKLVLQKSLQTRADNAYQLDCSTLNAGTYLLSIRAANRLFNKKLIINN